MNEEEIGLTVESAFESNEKKLTPTKSRKLKTNKIDLIAKRRFNKLIDQLEEKINTIKSNIHSELIDKLINYVYKFENELKNNLIKSYLDTGIISISCSETEYEFIFEQLIKKLNENNFNQIIYLETKDDDLNFDRIKEIIKNKILDDDLLDKLNIKNTHYKKFKQNLLTKELAKIYNENIGNSQPFIIIINDLISMNCDTIDNLFKYLHSNLKLYKLPFIVLCGLSQACVSLQSLIKPQNLNKLLLHSFASKNTFDIINEVFNSVFIGSKLDLRFGSKLLDHFYNTFLFYDNSINKIEHLAKLSIHFFCFENDYSYLNGNCVEEFIKKLDKMSSNDLKKLRNQFESIRNEGFSENDKKFKLELKNKFMIMNEIELKFLNELKSLYELIRSEDFSENNSFIILYIKYLSTDDKDFKIELNKLNKKLIEFTSDEWKEKSMKIINNDELNNTELSKILKDQLNKLNSSLNASIIVEEKRITFDKKNLKTHELKLRLKKEIKDSKWKSNSVAYDNWRKETIDLIKNHYYNLENPANTYLNEIFYFDDINTIKELNLISSRDTILKDIEDSTRFKELLNYKNSKELNNFNFDICDVFRTYRESEYKINLYDWLESSVAVLEQNELYKKGDTKLKSPRKKKKLTIDRNQLINRFINCVHSLEYIGLFESDSKSKDTITKLIH